jgi:predicted dehydrogenase
MENAKKMVEAAKKAKRTYGVCQNRRHLTPIKRLIDFIGTKKIGGITTLDSDFYLAPHFGGFREQIKHVLLIDMAIHTFDAARYILKADPVSVYCHEWNPKGSWYSHGASAVCIFEMTDGIVYTYRGSWCANGLSTAWECGWRIVGEKGTIKWDGGEKITCQIAGKSKGLFNENTDIKVPDLSDNLPQGHAGVISDFIDSIKAGRPPLTNCEDNIKSLAMVFGAVESAEKNKKIRISL